MEEIDIRELLSYFWEKIFYFFIIVLVAVTIGCVYAIFIQKPVYTSKTSIVLTGFSSSAGDSSITQTDLNVNSKLVSTYQEIVKSRRVLSQVIEKLDLSYSTKELADMISVYSVNDTEIIEIAVTNEKAKVACNVANEVAAAFGVEVKDLYNLSNVEVLDEAEVATAPSNMSLVKQIVIFLALGIVLACVVLFVLFYFDTTIKGSHDIEKRYGLPILGTVPIYAKSKVRGKKNEK